MIRLIEVFGSIITIILGVLFTFPFGSIIEMDHMAGILGIPFLIFLIICCLILLSSNSKKWRVRMRILIPLYLFTLVSYYYTIIIIRSNLESGKVFNYLYQGLSSDILMWFCMAGMILCFGIIYLYEKSVRYK